jgi:hypothetical protein
MRELQEQVMNQFTFILDLDGGTHASQVDAEGKDAALLAWCGKLQAESFLGPASKRLAKAVQRNVSGNDLVPLLGWTNTWCFTALFAKKLVLGHVVMTVGECP